MRLTQSFFLLLLSIAFHFSAKSQDSTAFKWTVESKKIGDHKYQLKFIVIPQQGWQLYAPDQMISDVPAAELLFADSSIKVTRPFQSTGVANEVKSEVFNATYRIYEKETEFLFDIDIPGTVPAALIGTMNYTYGKGQEFYPLNAYSFVVPLEGGVVVESGMKLEHVDLKNPVSPCGGTGAEGSRSLWRIFILGILGGLLGLIMPCTFPMIPLTVSFFTKQSQDRRKGIMNAFLYGFFIFFIYVLLSLPFYFLGASNSDILNNISTNAWLNIFFAIVFFVFALSFFGLFEISLPGSMMSKVDSKSSLGSVGGIFFMALTLAIVSFSCTGPILGTLLVGALNEDGGAVQLTVAMAGFGLALGLPFGLFALFPRWLSSLPRSGSWMNTVKIVFAFIELALMIKFLSNADLVMHWGILKREVFFGIWILIGLCVVLYLFGILKFSHDPPPKKLSIGRVAAALLFLAFTIYLIPGLTNTASANRALISGFPPPLTYSVYGSEHSRGKGVEADVVNDYKAAIQLAKKEGKPLLIDFTGWACVNCRKMEENVWVKPEVRKLIEENYILVSLYVDDRKVLPASEQLLFTSSDGSQKSIRTVGDKYATFQSENFKNASQPLYVILSADEKLLTLPVGYTPSVKDYAEWLRCGLRGVK